MSPPFLAPSPPPRLPAPRRRRHPLLPCLRCGRRHPRCASGWQHPLFPPHAAVEDAFLAALAAGVAPSSLHALWPAPALPLLPALRLVLHPPLRALSWRPEAPPSSLPVLRLTLALLTAPAASDAPSSLHTSRPAPALPPLLALPPHALHRHAAPPLPMRWCSWRRPSTTPRPPRPPLMASRRAALLPSPSPRHRAAAGAAFSSPPLYHPSPPRQAGQSGLLLSNEPIGPARHEKHIFCAVLGPRPRHMGRPGTARISNRANRAVPCRAARMANYSRGPRLGQSGEEKIC
jgi:hypothetical protein